MKAIKINATELRCKTRDLMERVKFNGDCFIVETFGRPMAVIISFDDYQRLKNAHPSPRSGSARRGPRGELSNGARRRKPPPKSSS